MLRVEARRPLDPHPRRIEAPQLDLGAPRVGPRPGRGALARRRHRALRRHARPRAAGRSHGQGRGGARGPLVRARPAPRGTLPRATSPTPATPRGGDFYRAAMVGEAAPVRAGEPVRSSFTVDRDFVREYALASGDASIAYVGGRGAAHTMPLNAAFSAAFGAIFRATFVPDVAWDPSRLVHLENVRPRRRHRCCRRARPSTSPRASSRGSPPAAASVCASRRRSAWATRRARPW